MSQHSSIENDDDSLRHETQVALATWRFENALRDLTTSLKAGYRADQPRVPAGQPNGGQWWSGSGPGHYRGEPDPPIEPVYPIENAIMFLSGANVIRAVGRAAIASSAALRAAGGRAAAESEAAIANAANAIERFLGGKGVVKRNPKNGNIYIMRGDKKVRFDIESPGNDAPHYHLQRQTTNGNWRDIKDHRYYFRDKP